MTALWVVTACWDGPASGLFSGRHDETPRVIAAEDPDDAIRRLIRQRDCLSLEHGVSFTVRPVGPPLDKTYHAQYDKPPFTEAGRSSGARLRIRKFTLHETEVEV